MRTMRQALANQVLRGGIVLSLAYLLVLQSLLVSLAQATLAAASAGPLAAVICTPGGLVSRDPTGDGEIPGETLPHWHCAALCQLASAAISDVPGGRAGVVSAPRQQIIAIAFIPAAIAPPAFHGRFAEARAPPFSI